MAKIEDKVRVGFIWDGGSWLGGRNYLINLFSAMRNLSKTTIEPVFFRGNNSSSPGAEFPGVPVMSASLLDRWSPRWLGRQLVRKASDRDWLLERFLVKHGIDVLSHSGDLGKNSSVAAISWIPDFQYLHLPELFSKEERESRNRHYAAMCANSARVIVSSESVKQDMCAFQPQFAGKASVLRFVASVMSENESSKLPDLRQRYGIADQYFLLPNQFWAHKNHRVVISALKLLKQSDKAVQVYATGSTEDPRNPEFFNSLMDYADECGVKDLFRPLGVVPFADLAGLMRCSIALINPSRFEGWSTSVEESKSMGKSIILSDIPVHREQAPRLGVYFSLMDAESLADAMHSVWQSYNPEIDSENQRRAAREFPARQAEFARTFEGIVSGVPYRLIGAGDGF